MRHTRVHVPRVVGNARIQTLPAIGAVRPTQRVARAPSLSPVGTAATQTPPATTGVAYFVQSTRTPHLSPIRLPHTHTHNLIRGSLLEQIASAHVFVEEHGLYVASSVAQRSSLRKAQQ